jgi:hypothetical protein
VMLSEKIPWPAQDADTVSGFARREH